MNLSIDQSINKMYASISLKTNQFRERKILKSVEDRTMYIVHCTSPNLNVFEITFSSLIGFIKHRKEN